MNFNENDLWRDKAELLNLSLSKLPTAKVLLKLEFDTEDQLLFMYLQLILYQKSSQLRMRVPDYH